MGISTCLLTLVGALALSMIAMSGYALLNAARNALITEKSIKGWGLAGMAVFALTVGLYVKKEVQVGEVSFQVTKCSQEKEIKPVVKFCPIESLIKVSKL